MLCHQALRALVMHNGRSVERALIEELIHHEVETGWGHPKRLQKNNY